MKKHILFSAALVGFSLLSNAQIILTKSDFAQVGDTIFYAYDTTNVTSGISLESGSNRNWDFSTAAKNEVKPSIFIDPSNSPVSSPADITHVLLDGDVQNTTFINLTTGGMETVIPNPLASFAGGEEFIRLKSLSFPATYMMQVRDTFKTQQVVAAGTLGMSALADSIRITFTIKLYNICDGWGNLKTASGTYPSLRFKNTVNIDFKIEGKRNTLPIWITIPLSSLPIPLPSNQDNVSYIWVHQNGKYFLAEATMVPDDVTTQEELRYQTPRPTNTGIRNEVLTTLDALAYPNPANNLLNIETNLIPNQTYTVSIMDITGKTVQQFEVNGTKNTVAINTTALSNGFYFARVFNNNSQAMVKFNVMH
jgi:hypothetical protein